VYGVQMFGTLLKFVGYFKIFMRAGQKLNSFSNIFAKQRRPR